MDNREKGLERELRAALSCDSFTAAYVVTAALFAMPFAAERGGAVIASILPIALVLPFAIMPVVYMLVHRAETLLFGRYHLIIPAAAVLSAMLFILAASASGGAAGDICLVFFSTLLFCPLFLSYRYCSFSVRARLADGGYKKCAPYAGVFAFLGGAAGIGAWVGFYYYSPDTVFLNTAYVIAGAAVLFVFVQYLITHYGIPRLGGKRVLSVKSAFRLLYSGLDKKPYFSSLMFESAFAALAMGVVWTGCTCALEAKSIFIAAAAVFAGYMVSSYACAKRVKRRSVKLSAACFACGLTAGVLFVIPIIVSTGSACAALITCGAAVTGIGGAIAVKQAGMRLTTVKDGITGGAVYILAELTHCAAFAVGIAAAAVVFAADFKGSAALIPAVAAICSIAGFVLTGKSAKREPRTRVVTYELNAQADTDDTTSNQS